MLQKSHMAVGQEVSSPTTSGSIKIIKAKIWVVQVWWPCFTKHMTYLSLTSWTQTTEAQDIIGLFSIYSKDTAALVNTCTFYFVKLAFYNISMFTLTHGRFAWDLILRLGCKTCKNYLYIMPTILSLWMLFKNRCKFGKEQKTAELEGRLDSVLQCSSKQQKWLIHALIWSNKYFSTNDFPDFSRY